jgi:hypothetical protein
MENKTKNACEMKTLSTSEMYYVIGGGKPRAKAKVVLAGKKKGPE